MSKINQIKFRKVLSKFATGVAVVSVNFKEKKIGKTINSFTSLSLNPPLILFALDKNASSLNEFKKSNYLSVNILSKKQKNISDNFAKKNAKWKNIEYDLSNFETPYIKNCIANLECKKIKILKQGDHIMFICKIISADFKDNIQPLLYFNSKYI